MVGISGRALGKITSSFMVITSDQQKTNLGLCLKFEAKSKKVIDYSRKEGRNWEYSEKAVELLREYKVRSFSDFFFSLKKIVLFRIHFQLFFVVLMVMEMVCESPFESLSFFILFYWGYRYDHSIGSTSRS